MKNGVIIWFCFLSALISTVMADVENWQNHLQKGLNHISKYQYQEACLEFDQALNYMSELDNPIFPFVLFNRAECNFFLQNYSKVLEDSEKALKSDSLTNYERLLCGSRRIAVFMKWDDDDAAVEEYNKYVIGNALMPQCSYTEDKIIIRNVLKCNLYQEMTKEWMLSKYCEKDEDIHKFDQTWIIDITKKQNASTNFDDSNTKQVNQQITIPQQILRLAKVRTTAEIQSCCNTCSKLAAASNVICGCFIVPETFAGSPILAAACTACCFAFVEQTRQDCERCCHNNLGKCSKEFESWKTDYKKKYSDCPQPPKCCN